MLLASFHSLSAGVFSVFHVAETWYAVRSAVSRILLTTADAHARPHHEALHTPVWFRTSDGVWRINFTLLPVTTARGRYTRM